MTQEDHVELVKTHTFMRKHATGTCKIELHVLHVERGTKKSSLRYFVFAVNVQHIVKKLSALVKTLNSRNFFNLGSGTG